jgi:hypothetical protein
VFAATPPRSTVTGLADRAIGTTVADRASARSRAAISGSEGVMKRGCGELEQATARPPDTVAAAAYFRKTLRDTGSIAAPSAVNSDKSIPEE